jgi:flavodoxin
MAAGKEVDIMKGVVAYDSVYGNTKQVAEAIAEQIRSEGHQVELIALRDGGGSASAGDFLFVGSPTRIGRMTKKAKEFVEGLDTGHWKSRPIVTFDTVGPLSEDEEKREKWLSRIEKSAATRMQELARQRGLSVHEEVLHVAVTGFKGPLASDALDRAKEFAHRFIATMR